MTRIFIKKHLVHIKNTAKFGYITKEKIKENHPNWLQISDYPFKILVTGAGSVKTISLFNLISHQPDTDKIYLYAKDPYEAKYQLPINKGESTYLEHLNI